MGGRAIHVKENKILTIATAFSHCKSKIYIHDIRSVREMRETNSNDLYKICLLEGSHFTLK